LFPPKQRYLARSASSGTDILNPYSPGPGRDTGPRAIPAQRTALARPLRLDGWDDPINVLFRWSIRNARSAGLTGQQFWSRHCGARTNKQAHVRASES
jgi:hypothetical protein